MFAFVIRRLLAVIPVLIGVSILTFIALHMVPGDMATLLIGPDGVQDPEVLANIRAKYGLDQPLIVQYLVWLRNVLGGDFGTSLRLGVPVLEEILRRLPLTMELTALAVGFALISGGTLGVLSVAVRGPWIGITQLFSIFGTSIPNYFLATLFILYGSQYLPWIPTLQYRAFSDDPILHLKGMIYPAIALGMGLASVIAQNTRAALAETSVQDYVRTARAKGLSEPAVLLRHILRNGAIPIITIVGLQMGYLLGGTIILETVFGLPGLGRLALSAATLRDYPLMQGIAVVIATMILLTNLITDICYSLVDPRLRIN